MYSNLRREAVDDLFVVIENDIDLLPQADVDLLPQVFLIPIQVSVRAASSRFRTIVQQMQAVMPVTAANRTGPERVRGFE